MRLTVADARFTPSPSSSFPLQSLPPYFQELLGPAPAGLPLPGNLAHHQPSAQHPQGAQGQQGQGQQRRGRDRDNAAPDLLEDEGPSAMDTDAKTQGGAAGAEGGQEGQEGGEGGQGSGQGQEGPWWAGDELAESAAQLVTYCRQQGSSVAQQTKARSLRPEQVAALWSGLASGWVAEHCGQLLHARGPLAVVKVGPGVVRPGDVGAYGGSGDRSGRRGHRGPGRRGSGERGPGNGNAQVHRGKEGTAGLCGGGGTWYPWLRKGSSRVSVGAHWRGTLVHLCWSLLPRSCRPKAACPASLLPPHRPSPNPPCLPQAYTVPPRLASRPCRQVFTTMLLALGVKSPSHLHVAVERYAEALRGALQDGDAAAALHAELAAPPGSWPAVAAAMGASLGQVAMLQV